MKTSSKDEDERRLQDVFIKSNVCWVSTNLEKTVANITSSDSHFIVMIGNFNAKSTSWQPKD